MKLDSSAFVADQELLDALEKRATAVVCEEDRILFHQGELPAGLFILQSGRATLSMHAPDGGTLMSIPLKQGSLLGLPGLVGNQPYSLTAKAMKGATLSFVTREAFSNMMLTQPALSLHVLRVLAAEVRNARTAITEV